MKWLALLIMVVAAAVLIILAVFMFQLPGQIARKRSHPYADAVSVCGWLGALTGVSWFVALIWAYMTPAPAGAAPRMDADEAGGGAAIAGS